MPQQILVIHGGDAFNSYEEYIEALKAKTVNLERETTKGWKAQLGERLGADYQVLTPQMPCKQNAKYSEWIIWFEKHLPFLRDGVILIGHSLGGIFLTKYLSENRVPVHIKATLLVAAPYNTPTEHPLGDFVLTALLQQFEEQAGSVILYHSADDFVVPFSNAERYAQALPNAELQRFENRGHFNDEAFPELEKDIQRIV